MTCVEESTVLIEVLPVTFALCTAVVVANPVLKAAVVDSLLPPQLVVSVEFPECLSGSIHCRFVPVADMIGSGYDAMPIG